MPCMLHTMLTLGRADSPDLLSHNTAYVRAATEAQGCMSAAQSGAEFKAQEGSLLWAYIFRRSIGGDRDLVAVC